MVEDDYDSEFRFEGRPLASLQGLDDAGCVVYLGSFSKVLFPALRVGYAVLPRGLIGPFQDAKDLTDRQTPILEQQVLAGFLGEGHFERHVRKMRQLYRVRREFLVASLERHLAGACQVVGAKAGMHLMVRLPPRLEEAEVVARAGGGGRCRLSCLPLLLWLQSRSSPASWLRRHDRGQYPARSREARQGAAVVRWTGVASWGIIYYGCRDTLRVWSNQVIHAHSKRKA